MVLVHRDVLAHQEKLEVTFRPPSLVSGGCVKSSQQILHMVQNVSPKDTNRLSTLPPVLMNAGGTADGVGPTKIQLFPSEFPVKELTKIPSHLK